MTDDELKQPESLPEEIHRRGLWQAAVGYLAVGWALIEVVDVMIDRGVLPESVFVGALVVLLLGFPVILATAYVQTPSRDTDGSATAAPARGGVARYLTWRNAILWGVGAFALLGVVTAVTTLLRVTDVLPDSQPIDPDRVAVLPFIVRGSAELEYLGEGIVDLVSAKLDGAGSLTTADPRAVIAGTNSRGFDPASAEDADRLAAELGAGRYVTGEVIGSSESVRLAASLRRTGEPAPGAARTATVDGTADEIFSAIDRLVAGLLSEVLEDEGDHLRGLAAITTESLEAVKEYLEGERLLRAARYREADAAYGRAIQLDSTFALAHYRKSITADWTDAPNIRSSADQALRFAERLSARERSLLRALSLRRNGHSAEAEQEFRRVLHNAPNDVEALLQYGELLFHDVSRQGRSMGESLPLFRRAADLEPNNLIAQLHLARLYAAMDSTERLAETSARVAEAGTPGERTTEVAALAAYTLDDSTRMAAVFERLRGAAWYYWWYSAHAIGNFVGDITAAEDLLSRREVDAPLLQMLTLSFDVMRGRHDEVRDALGEASRRDDPNWMVYEAFLLTSGAVAIDSVRAGRLASDLQPLTGASILGAAWIPPYEDRTPRFEEFQRDFLRGLLLVRAGREPEAAAILERLRAELPFEGVGTIKPDAERWLEAELRLAAGDRRGALETLRSLEYEVPHAMIVRPIAESTGSRLLRGQLELELGDPETAETVLLGLDQSWSPWDVHVRPEAYALLGRIAEEAGRVEDAIAYYTRLVNLWADADPALAARREEISAKRDALVRSVG